MGMPIIASWDTLRGLLQSTRSECSIFTPFYSGEGLATLDRSVKSNVAITIWTRLLLRDWATGSCDPKALVSLLAKRKETGLPIKLYVNQTLHAKAYFADSTTGLAGSANLTAGGFKTNVELMVRLVAEEASTALNVLTVASSTRSRLLLTDELANWVGKYEKLVERYRGKVEANLDELDSAQQESGLGAVEIKIIDPTEQWLELFVQWLSSNRTLPGAAHLLELHTDKVIQRQQGHVKQCFSGAFQFLQEQPALLQRLAATAGAGAGLVLLDGELLQNWKAHLKTRASDSSDFFSYRTLRRILPVNAGGTHEGGGGAGTTLRRILPLVARFMTHQGRQLTQGG